MDSSGITGSRSQADRVQFREGQTLEALSPRALRDNRIDAVVFCNTSGALPLPFTDMLCGTFDGHGPQVPATLNAGDKEHPANGNIGDIWTLSQEEMYLIKKHDR